MIGVFVQIGGGNIDLGFHALVEDPDHPDTHTFSLVTTTYSRLFNISKTTGVVTYAVDYDIDRTHPQNLSIIVKCTDKFGETGNRLIHLIQLIPFFLYCMLYKKLWKFKKNLVFL